MSTLKQIKNEVTGEIQLQGPAILKGELSTTTLENSNGKSYKLAEVEIDGKRGTAQIYEGNYSHPDANFEVGGSYLATISKGDGRGPLVQLSHLTSGGSRFEADAFADAFEAVEEQASVTEEV